MTLVDFTSMFEQTLPYVAAIIVAYKVTCSFKKAEREIAEASKHCAELMKHLTAEDTTPDQAREVGYDPDSDAEWVLPQPLPQATARYRA